MIKIIAILIAARDGEDASAHHVGSSVHQPRRITPLGEFAGQLLGQADPPIRQRQKHDAPVARQPAASRTQL